MEDVLKSYIKKHSSTKNVALNIIEHIENLETDAAKNFAILENQRDSFEQVAVTEKKKAAHLKTQLDEARDKITKLQNDAGA